MDCPVPLAPSAANASREASSARRGKGTKNGRLRTLLRGGESVVLAAAGAHVELAAGFAELLAHLGHAEFGGVRV